MAETIEIKTLSQRFSDLTAGTLDGHGLFDELMVTVKQHLSEEYSSQRLKGADYSKVYLGSMEASLINAVQYLLGVGTLDAQLLKLGSENKLIEAQIALAILEQEKTKAQTLLIEAQTETENGTRQSRIEELEAKVSLIEAQTRSEDHLLNARKDEILAKIAFMNAQKATEIALLNEREEELRAKTSLVNAQQKTEQVLLDERQAELVAKISLINAQQQQTIAEKIKTGKQGDLYNAQTIKTYSEKDLVAKKVAVEGRQMEVMTKQMALLKEQAEAYDKEIAIKKDKIQADAWSAKAVADGSGAGGPPSWT